MPVHRRMVKCLLGIYTAENNATMKTKENIATNRYGMISRPSCSVKRAKNKTVSIVYTPLRLRKMGCKKPHISAH